ncbi:MAG: radical SAM protein [Sedimentisphaerales bacterium]|nr:radical SAM protein [Sedimentisphaerales bacterium]
MKITLIYPGITDSGFNSLRGNEGSWMNHGLAILSSALKNQNHQVDLIDLRRLKGWKHFRQVVADKTSDVFGITMMSVDYDPAVKSAKIIRELKPKAKILVGGPHPSICPEELENLTCIDHIVKGEAEITFTKLIQDILNDVKVPKVIQGERPENLDDSPWADRDLFENPEEPFVPFLKSPFVTLIAGRGCRYNCNYCQPAERIMFGLKVRRRSADNVIKELKYLYERYHFNSFMIHDDCLTEDRPWVMDFCGRLKAEGFNQPFVAQSRADIICKNRDMVEALRDAGLKLFIIGFESGSDRVLKFLRKGCTRQQNLEAAHICKELGIKIWANYMLGLPTETKEEVLETLSMLRQIRPFHCSPAFYTPHPGSDLFEIGKKMGVHLVTSHDSYRRNTYEPKIKGPDYKFLADVLSKSIALEDPTYPGITFALRIKSKCKAAAARYPKLYRFLKNSKKIHLLRAKS